MEGLPAMDQASLLDTIQPRIGNLKGKTMKMLKLIVAAAALMPSAAFADCYRNADGSTWCNNANSTPAYPPNGNYRPPVPSQVYRDAWGTIVSGVEVYSAARGSRGNTPQQNIPNGVVGADQGFQGFNNARNATRGFQNWYNTPPTYQSFPQRQCWNGRSYVTC
jgi:hypothetical protein